ncbi:hypothetical protein TSMEX_005536 [Taenia solium]|eukprot:TsM_000057200 transcript=TsM_000057200 gene=TsM_000057200
MLFPHEFASPEPNSSIIFGTPEASVPLTKDLKSPTGDFVQPPSATRPRLSPSTRPYRKPRRSSLVTQRHILAVAKRVAEGRIDTISREGDYDGLNYAPIHQVNLGDSSSLITIAGQRARKMVRMAVSQASQSKTRQTKQFAGNVVEASKNRSVVFEEGTEAAPRLVKARQPLILESQELDVLDEVLNDGVASSRSSERDPEWVVSSSMKRKALGKSSVETVVLASSFVDALDDEWENGFDK